MAPPQVAAPVGVPAEMIRDYTLTGIDGGNKADDRRLAVDFVGGRSRHTRCARVAQLGSNIPCGMALAYAIS
jgi:hypothetical protein